MVYRIYFCFLLISFLCSLISFRLHYPFNLKMFALFLGLTLITEICAVFLLKFFHLHSNKGIYNTYMLIEYTFYAYFFKSILSSGRARAVSALLILLFPFLWFITTFLIFSFLTWNSYMLMLGDLFNIIMCVVYFYQIFTSETLIDLRKSAEFWICAGTFMYSCCEIPITGILNYLGNNYPSSVRSFEHILQILNMVMYSTFIYAYLCRLKTPTTRS